MLARKRTAAGPSAERRATDRNRLIQSVAETLRALEVISEAGGSASLRAIVAATGRPKGTVHRMLATLVNTGYLARDPETADYRLTLKLWRVGATAVLQLDIVKIARPMLERLVTDTDETVHLSILDESDRNVYISKVESPRSIRVQTRLGQVGPAWCTATGRTILAFNPTIAERVLAGQLERRTARTVTDPRQIRVALREVATHGYAITRAENHPEMGGIAAPVRDYTGSVIAGLGIGIPIFRMDRDLIARCTPYVVRAAAELSFAIGFRPGGLPASTKAA